MGVGVVLLVCSFFGGFSGAVCVRQSHRALTRARRGDLLPFFSFVCLFFPSFSGESTAFYHAWAACATRHVPGFEPMTADDPMWLSPCTGPLLEWLPFRKWLDAVASSSQDEDDIDAREEPGRRVFCVPRSVRCLLLLPLTPWLLKPCAPLPTPMWVGLVHACRCRSHGCCRSARS